MNLFPYFLDPVADGRLISSPLEWVWFELMTAVFLWLCFKLGQVSKVGASNRRRREEISGWLWPLALAITAAGAIVYEPILYRVYEIMPAGPEWLREFSVFAFYGLAINALLLVTGVWIYRLSRERKFGDSNVY